MVCHCSSACFIWQHTGMWFSISRHGNSCMIAKVVHVGLYVSLHILYTSDTYWLNLKVAPELWNHMLYSRNQIMAGCIVPSVMDWKARTSGLATAISWPYISLPLPVFNIDCKNVCRRQWWTLWAYFVPAVSKIVYHVWLETCETFVGLRGKHDA
jgi:hypothetical protein